MSNRPKLRRGEPWPSLKAEADLITNEIRQSWPGFAASETPARKPVDQTELAKLKRVRQDLEDGRNESIDREMRLQARIDELETEQERQQWAAGEDEITDEADDIDVDLFDDEPNEAEPASELNPLAQQALDAMSADQRAAYIGDV
jgi:hypothetical protein